MRRNIRNCIPPVGTVILLLAMVMLCAPARAVPFSPYSSPPPEQLSREEYLEEAETIFNFHVCPPLGELRTREEGAAVHVPPPTVTVAIVDSGIDPAHPELKGRLTPGYNFLFRNTDTRDLSGHGTMVAGVAALAGGAGCADQLRGRIMLMPLVVSGGNGVAASGTIADAIRYAADKGARIVNVSYGGRSEPEVLQQAVDYAWDRGAVVFAAAMNDTSGHPCFPAACDKVIAVAATGLNNERADFSNYGDWITLAADGTLVPTTTNGGGYAAVNGTSFASPAAAGLAALLLLANPTLSALQLAEILVKNADDLGDPGFDLNYGYGRVNPGKSLIAARAAKGLRDAATGPVADPPGDRKPAPPGPVKKGVPADGCKK